MLLEQQRVWSDYPADLKARLHVIVADDVQSPASAAFRPAGIASQRLFRMGIHRRWDWLSKRNLGVEKATTDWVLLTDIDHVLPTETLHVLLNGNQVDGWLEQDLSPKGRKSRVSMSLDQQFVYRFSRVDAHHVWPWREGSLTPYKEHPNSWLMTRAMFEQVGGFDERFSGFYGSDSDFRERCKSVPLNAATRPANGVVMLDNPLVRYPGEVVPDARTTSYERKAPEDGVNVPRIKAERALIRGWTPRRLQYQDEHGDWQPMPYTLEAQC